MFWDELKGVLNSLNILVRFDIKDVLFGILDTDNTSILVNYILLESKFFIYLCKLNKGRYAYDSWSINLKKHFKPNVLSRKKAIKSISTTKNGNAYSINTTVAVIQTLLLKDSFNYCLSYLIETRTFIQTSFFKVSLNYC